MLRREVVSVHSRAVCPLPTNASKEILLSKHLRASLSEVFCLVVVNTDVGDHRKTHFSELAPPALVANGSVRQRRKVSNGLIQALCRPQTAQCWRRGRPPGGAAVIEREA